MKTDAEQAMQLNTADVWADETPGSVVRTKPPGIQLLVALAFVVLGLAVGAVVWIYFSGLKELQAVAAQAAEGAPKNSVVSQVVAQSNHWSLELALGAVASGTILFLVAVLGASKVRSHWLARSLKAAEEADVRAHKLLGQLADAKVSEEEARKEGQELQMRLANLAQQHAHLEEELEKQRNAEKTLTHQTTMLHRSKDVLEMHVQARTQELQKLQRHNELILNSAGDGICGFDLSGKSTFVNPAAARITGWRIQDLMGRTEEAIFFPARSAGKEISGLVKDANGDYLAEQLLFRNDGSCFSAEYVRTPIKEKDKVVGTVVMFKDITERRLAEDKLNRKALELARSNRELEQFAFVASHDLQEPLRKIQAFGDRLKAKCETVQLDEGRDYLERMQNAAARMQTLINDLLTFSRVISSQQPFVPVDLGKVTQEVLGDLEWRIQKTSAQVQAGALPTIEADPTQMRQLLQNLIGNALKFQPAGAVPQIKIEAQLVNRDQIAEDAVLPKTANASPEDKFCVLTVLDNGIGFDEQYLDKVFAVFQRLHGRSEYEGTGVGLAVCRRITDRHGGYITAQSKPGEGSTFVAILPMEQPKTAPEGGA